MTKRVTIIGAGINGLVAANYLVRAGFDVTMIERNDHPGGACVAGTWDGCQYPQGASVLGFMEDFVFEQTGLAQRISAYTPDHPEIVWAPQGMSLLPSDPQKLAEETAYSWNEQGDVIGFCTDMERVISFLQNGYKTATVPTLDMARAVLGQKLVDLWITGSARHLLDSYLTSEPLKLFYAVSVVESGPVPLNSPYSAFTIPLMESGSVFDGKWGYVKGGIWQIPIELDKINRELGVRRIFSTSVDSKTFATIEKHSAHVIFATDPLTAARTIGDQNLVDKISNEVLLGTSGKVIMFFKKPARWKDETGSDDFHAALRHIIPVSSLDESERVSELVASGAVPFTPGYYEIYCEGEGNRHLGGSRKYDLVSVFYKNIGFGKHGSELDDVKKIIVDTVLKKIKNPEDFAHAILETPKDLSEMFLFPKGNIDDVELTAGQTFFQRNYSPNPESNFYQFGSNPKILYAGAGSYPCGSVAGTPGYMCAKQLIQRS